jgi:hypothetical protein
MAWKDLGRPGYFGSKRSKVFGTLDHLFGEGNWRISWKWLGQNTDFKFACHLYEDAYYSDSSKREGLWRKLLEEASEVYDYKKEDISSGFDYEIQRGEATHLQDIAIRRVVARRGWKFKGKKPVQIRSHKSYLGSQLSPGKVPFHLPEHIIQGLGTDSELIEKISGKNKPLVIWWDKYSVEDFYQSNKFLQVREVNKNDFPSLVTDLNEAREAFLRKQEPYERESRGIKKLLQRETERVFEKVSETVNERLRGKAPAIAGFDVEGNYVELRLDCPHEELTLEKGELITSTVKQELEIAGFGWIYMNISHLYYGK